MQRINTRKNLLQDLGGEVRSLGVKQNLRLSA